MKRVRLKPKRSRLNQSPPLLCARAEAARLLGCSQMTIIRLEEEGHLSPVRLRQGTSRTGRATGAVFYRVSEVHALAEIESDTAA